MKKLKFFIRNIAKMIVQNTIFPVAYFIAKLKHTGEKTLYVFADAHNVRLPFSLEFMYRYLLSKDVVPVCHFYDYTHEGTFTSLMHGIAFMDLLAQAKYVFICDTFLPVSSCRIDAQTKVVQLCHYSGPFKKIGYDTKDDVPAYYLGNVFKNYALVSVSSEYYVPRLSSAMRQEPGVVQALGVSRSDSFFDEEWLAACRDEFYAQYPQARNKKVLLWAPTFRGKASSPDALDNESFSQLQSKLGDDWLVLIKHHPHDDATAVSERYRSNCKIPSERLLPIVDVLVTDYSTIVLDYLAFEKPFILYAPDLEEYEKLRGFYLDYRKLTKNLTDDAKQLDTLVKQVYQEWLEGEREDIRRCKELITSACDGRASERILDFLYYMENIRD